MLWMRHPWISRDTKLNRSLIAVHRRARFGISGAVRVPRGAFYQQCRAVAAIVTVTAVMLVAAGCSAFPLKAHAVLQASKATGTGAGGDGPLWIARTHQPSALSVLPDTDPEALTAQFARSLFGSSPVVVVAADTATAVTAARQAAGPAHAPVLLASAVNAALTAAVRGLSPDVVLVEGLPSKALAAKLPGVRVVSRAAQLPATGDPAPVSRVAVLVSGPGTDLAITAVTATAAAAGATVVSVPGADPRADPAAIETLSRLKPTAVVAVGKEFGPASRLQSRLAVAETGRQLPGGGQVMFPGRRLVALYGHPGTPGLGVLGEQDLPASITRAKAIAAEYQPLGDVPVVPTFEIIATVAEASPGPDDSYSYETPVSQLLPWVQAATQAGMYVVLDLQPGRDNLLDQAEVYQSLLKLPNVGLALDPEWKLQPGQVPLQQIGHVDIAEVNSVISWLAQLTARYHLPQKLLVLHQFQLSMISGEQYLDTSNDDLAIVIHMDGQGTPADKQATWDAVTYAAPKGVFFGWKNFLVKDHPMLTPQETMTKTPTPAMVSYQ
jgi:hypothetical protein